MSYLVLPNRVSHTHVNAYADISTSTTCSITPRPQVLLLPTIQSPADKPLAWVGLAHAEEGNKEVRTEESSCQRLPHTSTPRQLYPSEQVACASHFMLPA